ncbi:hypothetical protein [Archangium sp.]|uniref:hypothetical protein n=1 Tax=Archangium sp. TaxID=1872627 RepID=UPI002D722536|nr:hypothetical protein [Archangium sp.]HYO51502.1 hypothetical protein [Archangium sp.]
MKSFWIVLSIAFTVGSCRSVAQETRVAYFIHPDRMLANGLAMTYIPQGNCPNWNEALAIAKGKMGCVTGGKQLSEECRKRLPCDVCQLLKDGAWPPAHVVDFPASQLKGVQNTIYGAVLYDPEWQGTCPVDDKTRVEFKKALCSGEGQWGFDKIDTLAKAMVHESLHLCKLTGGTGPATADKGFWDYLFCSGADAADVVDLCWRSEG